MRTTRTSLLLALGLASALALSACAPGGAPTTPGGSGADATLEVGLVLQPTDLNILTTSGVALDQVLIDNVYEGLVRRGTDGEILDSLARSHSVSEDGLRYSFTLERDVRFHSGNPLTAEDVVWSLSEVRDNPSYKGHPIFANIASIEAPDQETVQLVLAAPDADLLWNLGGRGGQILERVAGNDIAVSANGTGPFTAAEGAWKQGDSLTLTRNDDYWGTKPRVGEVVFSYIPEPTTAVNAMLAGDIDVQTSVNPNLRAQLEGAEGITLTEGRTTDKYTLAFNNAREPLTDVRVREALRLGIDNAAVIRAMGGAGVLQGGPIPELDPGYEDLTALSPFDPERARALLAEAGHPNLSLNLSIANHYSTEIPNVLVSQLRDIGVTLNVSRVDFPAWLNDVYTNHDYDLSIVNHAEARDFQNWANPDYYFGYNNPAVQSLYTESIAAIDPAAQAEKLREAARMVAEDHAADWLFTATVITAVREGVTGFPTESTTSRLYLGDVAVSE